MGGVKKELCIAYTEVREEAQMKIKSIERAVDRPKCKER